MKILKRLLPLILLFGCASIPSNKIKLKDYPEVTKADSTKLDLSYEYKQHNRVKGGTRAIDAKFVSLRIEEYPDNKNARCKVVSTLDAGVYSFWTCPIITNAIAPFTLFTIPLYCQYEFEARAAIIDTKTNEILKTYYFADNAHEIWSIIFAFGVASKYQKDNNDWGSRVAEKNVAEALVRSVITDAKSLPQCQKK